MSTECVPTKVPVITEGVPGSTQRAPVKVLVTTLTERVPTEVLVTAEWVPVATKVTTAESSHPCSRYICKNSIEQSYTATHMYVVCRL